MADTYADPRVECTESAVRLHGYYLPYGTKTIPYGSIRAVTRVDLGLARGRARIWGTANPRYWANLDPGRPRKRVGFVLDLGRAVRPFVTPDDPAGFEAALHAHTSIEPTEGPAPII